MISRGDLRKVAKARLRDSEILYSKQRYDGAVYLCGYAVEMALKARICRTLKWLGFPETNAEFQAYSSFKIHNLEVLLHLSGVETKVRTQYLAEWSEVVDWRPEDRYKPVGTAGMTEAQDMIAATKTLLKAI